MTELAVVANRRLLGVVTRSPGDDLSFAYGPDWLRDPDAFPLSLSLPLRPDPFRRSVLEPWLAGLLPDDENVLRAWSARFHVSRRNVFGLLAEVGEDCAGAVQLVRPERLDRGTSRRGPGSRVAHPGGGRPAPRRTPTGPGARPPS